MKGRSTPCFRPMSSVAKRSPISATAKLLFIADVITARAVALVVVIKYQ